ncbi:MAG: ferredoxin [Eubacterium sp.]|nr:ferredoxin [Eubacterium sp.]
MAKVTFTPDNITIHVKAGTTILEAARSAGIKIESPCNGAGTCGKCKLYIEQVYPVNAVLTKKNHPVNTASDREYILACTACISHDLSITTDTGRDPKALKIISRGESFEVELDCLVTKKYVEKKGITEVYAGHNLIAAEEGNSTERNFGIVVDIGTTTLVASLVDLNTGNELQTASSLNPQAIYAQDVLSRIKLASEGNGLNILYKEVIDEINGLINEVSVRTRTSKENIYEIIFSGNTCMLHLAAGINPYSLGKFPYTPEIKGGGHIKASDHNISIAKEGIVYLPPVISAYVGADITSGILASQIHKKAGVILFVDIGTNGEMVISRDGRLTATSTAAGPAFEGMNITCGMRADKGAVELFDMEEDYSIRLEVIGDTAAVGICGSGLLDIVGELVAAGAIKRNGKFADAGNAEIPPVLAGKLVQLDGKTVFKVTEKVFLSQNDIRQVQLAKGAIRAGIEFLLESIGVTAAEVDSVLIAGSFGYHLRAKSLINIGLLPQQFDGKIQFIGNTSKSGGRAFLINKGYRREMEQLVKEVEVIELANYKNFDRVFVKCLSF